MDKKKKLIVIGISVAVLVVVAVAIVLALTLNVSRDGENNVTRQRKLNSMGELSVAIGERLVIPKIAGYDETEIYVVYNVAVTKEYAASVNGYDEKASGFLIVLKMGGVRYEINANIDPLASVTFEPNEAEYDEKSISNSGIATKYYVSKNHNRTYFVLNDGLYTIKGASDVKDYQSIEKIVKAFFM